jgi:hypothetical protein
LQLGRRLHALSQGEPLVLGLYLRSFERTAAPRVDALAALPPGLDGVFEHWLVELAQQRQRDPSCAMSTVERHLFNLLACAFEPLPRPVLLAVMRTLGACGGDELDAALRALARFIVGDAAGYALGHPELARWRWRRLQRDDEARPYDEAFARWMGALLADDGAAAVDAYALRAGTRHLERSGCATLGDWHRVAGDRWRAQHQRSDGWPQDYAADLTRAAEAAHAADQADLAANQACRGLPLRAAIGFARQAIDRLTQRVPARLAAQALCHGLWTSARTLQQLLAAHAQDFPRIAALGAIAPWLAVPELEPAMAALALERAGGFDWDDTLGTWELAAAAARSAAFDDATLASWAQSLPGLGAAIALLALAAASEGDARSRWLAPALAALPASARQTGPQLLFGRRDDLRAGAESPFDAWSFGTLLGFRWDLAQGQTAAAALRVAWPWLGEVERAHCVDALVDRLAQWIEVLRSSETMPSSDERWSIAHRDWQPRLGAIWDVCSIDVARNVHRQLHRHFAAESAHGSNQRTCFGVMLRFASRLSPDERRFERLGAEVRYWAFGQSSTFQPEIDELYAAAAALPEWSALGEQLPWLRAQRRGDAVRVLEVIARQLPPDALERQWLSVGDFDTDQRDRARRAILGAMAGRGEAALRQALQRRRTRPRARARAARCGCSTACADGWTHRAAAPHAPHCASQRRCAARAAAVGHRRSPGAMAAGRSRSLGAQGSRLAFVGHRLAAAAAARRRAVRCRNPVAAGDPPRHSRHRRGGRSGDPHRACRSRARRRTGLGRRDGRSGRRDPPQLAQHRARNGSQLDGAGGVRARRRGARPARRAAARGAGAATGRGPCRGLRRAVQRRGRRGAGLGGG